MFTTYLTWYVSNTFVKVKVFRYERGCPKRPDCWTRLRWAAHADGWNVKRQTHNCTSLRDRWRSALCRRSLWAPSSCSSVARVSRTPAGRAAWSSTRVTRASSWWTPVGLRWRGSSRSCAYKYTGTGLIDDNDLFYCFALIKLIFYYL